MNEEYTIIPPFIFYLFLHRMKETLSSRFRKFTSGTLALAMIASIVAPIGNVVNAAGTPDFTAIQTVASEAAGVNNQSFNINSNTLNGTGSYATGASSGIDGIDIIAANVGTGTNLVNVTITDNDTDDCFLTTMS